jgi:hypothetical protein
VLRFYEERIPEDINTAAAFHKWLEKNEDCLMLGVADVVDEDLEYLGLDAFPDSMRHGGDEYSLYYHAKQGERDDGVTLRRACRSAAEIARLAARLGSGRQPARAGGNLLRSLPKDYRRVCQPIGPVAEGFSELWSFAPKDRPIFHALSEYARERTGPMSRFPNTTRPNSRPNS